MPVDPARLRADAVRLLGALGVAGEQARALTDRHPGPAAARVLILREHLRTARPPAARRHHPGGIMTPTKTRCSAARHADMYREGWNECCHCGEELVTPFDPPNDVLTVSGGREKTNGQ